MAHDTTEPGEPAQIIDESEIDTIAGIQFGADEEVLHDARPSWAAWPKSVIVALVGALPTLGMSLILLVYPWMARKKTRYVVTSNRVVKVEGGMLGKDTTEYRIDDIRTIRTSASTLEKILNTGTIELDTHSGATMNLAAVPNRDDVANAIRAQQTA